MTDVNIKSNDLEVLWVPPQSDTDQRVPTAQEMAASSHLHQQNLEKAQALSRPAGLLNRPTFTATIGSKGIIVPAGLAPYAPGHPALGAIASATTITLPSLADTVSSVSRYDRIYLAAFGAIVTGAVDADLLLPFEWRSQSNIVQTLTKENTRRIRTFWALVWSQGVTTASALYTALPGADEKAIAVSKAATGILLSSTLRIYPLDPNLLDTKSYTVLSDTVELIDLCRVWRVQNFNQAGYFWGRGGEKDFEPDFHFQPTYRYVGTGWEDWSSRARATVRRIFLGLPLIESPTYDRAVQNLINGQVGSNLDAPGVAIASPNGSTALANGQRVSFSNQPIIQKTYALPIATSNAGGFAQASVPFQANSPAGSRFSESISDHKVYSATTGRDITLDGTITGLGGTGALVWTANSNAAAAPGDTVYFQPGIYYPPGSGFAVTGEIEKVFLDATEINAANVREASVNDFDVFTTPAASGDYLVVLGKERAALHAIYKKVSVTSSSSGVVTVPSGNNGAIAFISGTGAPTTRQDKPVIAGLSNSTSYTILCYYPPQADESWQFQIKTSRYAGSGERSWLNGAQIETHPIAFAHTQGGGNAVFLAEGEVQYEAIAFRLPANTIPAAVKHFSINHKIQFANEADFGQTSFREIALSAAAGLVVPRPGITLSVSNGASAQTKGIAAKLQNSLSKTLGCLKIPIQCSQPYQLVVAFVAVKGSDRRLLMATFNEGDVNFPSGVSFDTDASAYAGIDTFTLF